MPKKNLIAALILISVVFLFYLDSFKNEFVWDDFHFIVKDPGVHDLSRWPVFFTHNIGFLGGEKNNFYRPLYSFLNALNYKMGGGTPFIFHFTNTLLHAATAVLSFFLIYLICGNTFISAGAAILFALHPVQTQAVTYIAGRADPMYSLFGLISIILFILSAQGGGGWFIYGLSLLSFICAILSKEAAIIIPFLMLLVVWSPRLRERLDAGRVYRRMIPFFLILIIYGLSRATILDFSKNIDAALAVPAPTLYLRILTSCEAIFLYFRFLLLPIGFHMETFLPAARSVTEMDSLAVVLGVVLIMAGLFHLSKKDKMLFFAFAWFFLALLPVSNLFPINAAVAIHWLYLPSLGFFFAVSLILWRLSSGMISHKRGRNIVVFTMILALVGLALGVLTHDKNRQWRSDEMLYENILASSQTPRVCINLGNTFTRRNEFDEAIPYYLRALEIAPGQTEALANLGYIYDEKGDYIKAEEVLKRAIRLNPGLANAHFNLAVTYFHMGRYDAALGELDRTLEINPNHIPALNALGKIHFQCGRRDEARKAFGRSLALERDQPEIQNLLKSL